jgi:hypothetical protein
MGISSRLLKLGILGGSLVLGACTDQMDSPLAPNIANYRSGASHDVTGTGGTSLEQLYLMENLSVTSVGDGSILYQVAIVGGQAQLTQLYSMTGTCTDAAIDCNVYFDQAHIGATPDGKKIYAVNRQQVGSGNPVGVYDVAAGTFQYLGEVSGLPANGTVLVGFSPDGLLYAANMDSNEIYRLDLGTMSIAQSWQVNDTTGAPVDLNGADIAFGADGTLYLWTNANGLGLYTVDLSGTRAVATRLGTGTYPFVTGLAIRDAGKGDLLGSSSENDVLYQISKTDGSLVTSYPLVEGGLPYDHVAGDMTAGIIKEPPPPPPGDGSEGCTPGYWKQTQHYGSWKGYSPNQLFSSVFEDAFPGMTLVQVLGQGGGGLNALGRHTVAALLDAASGIDYGLTTAQVIQKFNDVYPGGGYEGLKDEFATRNERGCPLGRDDGGDDHDHDHDHGSDCGSSWMGSKSYGSKGSGDMCTCDDSKDDKGGKDGKYGKDDGKGWTGKDSKYASYNWSGSDSKDGKGSSYDCGGKDDHDGHDHSKDEDCDTKDGKGSGGKDYPHDSKGGSYGSKDSKGGSYGSKDSKGSYGSGGHGLLGWLF